MDEKDRIIAESKAEIAALKKEIEELKEIIKELLNRNSGNSSQPPSLDKFPKKTKKPSGKPRL